LIDSIDGWGLGRRVTKVRAVHGMTAWHDMMGLSPSVCVTYVTYVYVWAGVCAWRALFVHVGPSNQPHTAGRPSYYPIHTHYSCVSIWLSMSVVMRSLVWMDVRLYACMSVCEDLVRSSVGPSLAVSLSLVWVLRCGCLSSLTSSCVATSSPSCVPQHRRLNGIDRAAREGS